MKFAKELLTKIGFEALTPEAQTQYLKDAKEFVDTFNAANPGGLKVSADLLRIVFGKEGRPTFVIAVNNNLNTTAFSSTYEIADILATNVGLPSAEALASLLMAHPVGNKYITTVKAVNAGDTYKTKDGVKAYTVPQMVAVDGTRDEIALGPNAADFVAEAIEEALKQSILAANTRSRRNTGGSSRRGSAVSATTPVDAEVEADI
jgi:hypothetical protein